MLYVWWHHVFTLFDTQQNDVEDEQSLMQQDVMGTQQAPQDIYEVRIEDNEMIGREIPNPFKRRSPEIIIHTSYFVIVMILIMFFFS